MVISVPWKAQELQEPAGAESPEPGWFGWGGVAVIGLGKWVLEMRDPFSFVWIGWWGWRMGVNVLELGIRVIIIVPTPSWRWEGCLATRIRRVRIIIVA